MVELYYVCYVKEFDDCFVFDDIVVQFIIMENWMWNEMIGLLYYGYDEVRVQVWVDLLMGCLLSIWGWLVGWFVMGVFDMLEFFFVDYFK